MDWKKPFMFLDPNSLWSSLMCQSKLFSVSPLLGRGGILKAIYLRSEEHKNSSSLPPVRYSPLFSMSPLHLSLMYINLKTVLICQPTIMSSIFLNKWFCWCDVILDMRHSSGSLMDVIHNFF